MMNSCAQVCLFMSLVACIMIPHTFGDEGEKLVQNSSEEFHEGNHKISKRTVKGKHHVVGGVGTSCIVKGSYCSCHYCKCDHGMIHCQKHGVNSLSLGHGKHYCYGTMEGEHCHCDYCKCKHGYGQHGHGHACGGYQG